MRDLMRDPERVAGFCHADLGNERREITMTRRVVRHFIRSAADNVCHRDWPNRVAMRDGPSQIRRLLAINAAHSAVRKKGGR